ncbi:lysophospholipid acyltransferase family protein [Patescibacteria group bacterium]
MAYPLTRLWLIPLLRKRVKKISGKENLPASGPFVVVANHNSWMDSPLLAAVLSKFQNKKVYFIASSRKYAWFGSIPINRKNPSAVLKKCIKCLKRGSPVVIFPEGKSNEDKFLRIGKTGAARLALSSRTPVIPIGMRGGKGVHAMMGIMSFWAWWRHIEIRIGRQIDISEYYDQPVDYQLIREVTDKFMVAISSLSGKPIIDAY